MALTEVDISALEQAVLDFDEEFFTKEKNDSAAWQIGHLVATGSFSEAVFHEKSPLVSILQDVKTQTEGKGLNAHDIVLKLRDAVEDHLLTGTATSEKHLALIFSAVGAFMVFVQANWTGPALPTSIQESLIPGISNKEVLAELSVDGETVYAKAVLAPFLLVARQVLMDNVTYVKHSKSISWWSARFGFKLQALLSGPSETLRNFVTSQYQKSMFAYSSRPEILLEYGLTYHHYKDSQRAREYFLKAKSASKLYCELSGMMGRRTKYQTFDTAQLVLLAQSYQPGREVLAEDSQPAMTPSHYVDKDSLEAYFSEESSFADSVATPIADTSSQISITSLPSEIVPDEDDIRLKAPKLVADEKNHLAEDNLKIVDQCILLGLCLDVRNENPKHGLTSEQMKAYVERVMMHPNNWMVHSMALLVKSRLEMGASKYVDRAAMQLQVLADQFNEVESAKEYPAQIRSKRIFQVLYPPLHRLKGEIGELYLSLGAAKSALAIFEELEMWSDAIAALQVCGEDERARALVRARIEADGETPEWLCLMGDVSATREEKIENYSRCWQLSRGRYPRAKRQLGKLAMDVSDYQGALLHYKEALAVNPQYGFAWFRMGCCALELMDFEQAQLAFTRVTYLHPDDAEAWSNLAASCLKLNKLKEAHSAFKEALKHNQDNWRIWDNYMVTSVKLGYLQESVYCLHKLLELNSSVDVEVLEILVNIATTRFSLSNPLPHQETESQYVHKQLRTLLGRITTQISNNPELWAVYAKYYQATGDLAKVVEFRQKQCRTLQTPGSETDAEKFDALVKALTLLVQDVEAAKDKSIAYSTKLQIRSLLKKSKDAFDGSPNHIALAALVPRLEALE
jgi:tetratricopeptide (TPR) repeat protein